MNIYSFQLKLSLPYFHPSKRIKPNVVRNKKNAVTFYLKRHDIPSKISRRFITHKKESIHL